MSFVFPAGQSANFTFLNLPLVFGWLCSCDRGLRGHISCFRIAQIKIPENNKRGRVIYFTSWFQPSIAGKAWQSGSGCEHRGNVQQKLVHILLSQGAEDKEMEVLCRLYPFATFIIAGLIMHRMVPPRFRIDLSTQLFFLLTQTHPEMYLTIFSVILNLAKLTMKIRNHKRLIHTSILVTCPLFYIIRAIGTKHNDHDKHRHDIHHGDCILYWCSCICLNTCVTA